MTCHNCRIETVKAGRNRYGVQRHKCQQPKTVLRLLVLAGERAERLL
jgi:hypothetical protein